MAIQIRCPHCGKIQLPSIRVKTLGQGNGVEATQDPHKTLHVMMVLLLSLTIVGLPLAYWLCQRFDRQYPILVGPKLQYSYQCSLCGYKWKTRTDEPLPQGAAGKMLEPQGGIPPASSAKEGMLNFSALQNLSAWWFDL